MSIELFGCGHEFHSVADALDTVGSEVLESHLATVAVEVDAAIGGSISVGRQRVIGAAGIVACTLAGIFAEEHATRIDYLEGELLVILCLDDEVLGCVGIREVDGLLMIVDEHEAAVLERLLCDLLTGQEVELAVHLCLYVEDHLLGGGDEEHLRVDAVLGL